MSAMRVSPWVTASAFPFEITGNNRYTTSIWQATARGFEVDSGNGTGAVLDKATRTATNCYMRGLKERITISGTTSKPLIWRRVVFSFTGQEMVRVRAGASIGQLASFYELTSQGWSRPWTQINPPDGGAGNEILSNVTEIVFKGVQNSDWRDMLEARIDSNRVKLHYDKTVNITSHSDAPVHFKVSRWHPLNKTLIYNDDEYGGRMFDSVYSINNRQSTLGDVYVMDIFDAGPNGEELDIWQVLSQATLYWHER